MSKRYIGIHGGTMSAPKGLRFVGWHDANITILDENGELIIYGASERYGQRKKHDPDLDILINYKNLPNIKQQKEDIVFCTTICANWEKIEKQNPVLAMKFQLYKEYKNFGESNFTPSVALNHHLCHIISSWCFRKDNQKRFAIAYDGAGPTPYGQIGTCLGGLIDDKGFEIIEIEPMPSSGLVGSLLFQADGAGKLMGLSGYYNIQDADVEKFNKEDLIRLIKCYQGELFHGVLDQACFLINPHLRSLNKDDLLFAAKIYKMWMNFTWDVLEKNINCHISDKNMGIVIGGGTCLALEVNTKIRQKVKDLVFGPPVNDSGLSLGAAAYAYFMDTGRWPKPLKSPSIMYLQQPLPEVGPQEPNEIAKLISDNKVVGLLRGKAECGPRALGFRSIFANACRYENLKRVSEDLKGREYYRPLSPIVTAESFERYFIGPPGEYMQYKCECTEETQKKLPSIVHKDNSARPQVVYKENDPWLHELLVEYGRLTGHECMINTSLNGKGKPICNTYQDAVDDFKNKDIELVSISDANHPAT